MLLPAFHVFPSSSSFTTRFLPGVLFPEGKHTCLIILVLPTWPLSLSKTCFPKSDSSFRFSSSGFLSSPTHAQSMPLLLPALHLPGFPASPFFMAFPLLLPSCHGFHLPTHLPALFPPVIRRQREVSALEMSCHMSYMNMSHTGYGR